MTNDTGLKTLKLENPFLPLETYNICLANQILSTVDFIIEREDSRFLLIIRTGQNRWNNVRWFFGGGQRRGEKMEEALARLLRAEAGVKETDIVSTRFSHCYDTFNPATPTQPACHTMMHVNVVRVRPGFHPVTDKNSRDPEWFDESLDPRTLPEPVAYSLWRAGLINRKP